MSDSLANTQLELACRVGSREDVLEALEDGADINCNGNSPLFIAIMANDRSLVSTLVEKGADVSAFEVAATGHEEIVDALMLLSRAEDDKNSGEAVTMVEVDGKLVRAFDKMIRSKGLAEPFHKGRGDEYAAFCSSLRWIAAEECYANVSEFLEMVELTRKESGAEDDKSGIRKFLNDNAARIDVLSRQYAEADEVPGDLVKEYLKERRKVA